jgi:hypothetical protein
MSTPPPGKRHLAFIVQRGVTLCMTCWTRVGPSWQDRARHAGVLARSKEVDD